MAYADLQKVPLAHLLRLYSVAYPAPHQYTNEESELPLTVSGFGGV